MTSAAEVLCRPDRALPSSDGGRFDLQHSFQHEEFGEHTGEAWDGPVFCLPAEQETPGIEGLCDAEGNVGRLDGDPRAHVRSQAAEHTVEVLPTAHQVRETHRQVVHQQDACRQMDPGASEIVVEPLSERVRHEKVAPPVGVAAYPHRSLRCGDPDFC